MLPHKLNAVIIDDELSGRTMIEFYLKEFMGDLFENLVAVSNINAAAKAIDDLKPHIVFSDYELRGENGLMVQQHLSEDIPVVVVSAHSQYAVEAIHCNVLDYLLKPLNESEMIRFRERLIRCFEKKSSNLIDDNINIVIKDGGENIVIPINEVVFLEACGAYSKIITENKNYIASKTLKSLENQLPEDFIRVHRSYIVPVRQIKSFTSSDLCLKNGYTISLSKTGKRLLQQHF
ncbi:MAG: LytR/AlgR family response regulator transcription factor [Bacteroidia bacterium]